MHAYTHKLILIEDKITFRKEFKIIERKNEACAFARTFSSIRALSVCAHFTVYSVFSSFWNCLAYVQKSEHMYSMQS